MRTSTLIILTVLIALVVLDQVHGKRKGDSKSGSKSGSKGGGVKDGEGMPMPKPCSVDEPCEKGECDVDGFCSPTRDKPRKVVKGAAKSNRPKPGMVTCVEEDDCEGPTECVDGVCRITCSESGEADDCKGPTECVDGVCMLMSCIDDSSCTDDIYNECFGGYCKKPRREAKAGGIAKNGQVKGEAGGGK